MESQKAHISSFSKQILADLIKQGYRGKELLKNFRQTQQKIRPAVEAMLAEADQIAESKSGGCSLEDVFGNNAKTYTINTLGIRKARFITISGAIMHFVKKIKLRGKEYSMFSSYDEDGLVHSKTRIGRSDSVFGRFFSYFFDN